jgi:hypothetical protein
MATPSSSERVKASRLRAKQRDGRKLTAEESEWIAGYDRVSFRSRVAAALAVEASAASRAVSSAHETAPPQGSIAPADSLWIPKMNGSDVTSEEQREAIDVGLPPRPAPGAPLLAEPERVASETVGDPVAAKQFAAFVQWFMRLGIAAGRDLAVDAPIPQQARLMIASDEIAAQALSTVGEAAERVSLKYGFKQIPLADEVMVAGALVGSGVLIVKQAKRRTSQRSIPKSPEAAAQREQPPQQQSQESEQQDPLVENFTSHMWGS